MVGDVDGWKERVENSGKRSFWLALGGKQGKKSREEKTTVGVVQYIKLVIAMFL